MPVKSERNLDDLALIFEHFVRDNGNGDVHASNFRGCLTEDTTFDNGIKIGIVWAYVHSALKYLQISGKLTDGKLEEVAVAIDKLFYNRSFQGVVDALNYLADKCIAV